MVDQPAARFREVEHRRRGSGDPCAAQRRGYAAPASGPLNPVHVACAQDDDTIIGWNLFNEPRCNCAPSVISPSGQVTAEGAGSECANVAACAADMKVRPLRELHRSRSRQGNRSRQYSIKP